MIRRLKFRKELFYILGALLGDGCAYYWKKGNRSRVILVGEKEFIEKYSIKLSKCINFKIKGYPNRSKNIWQHKTENPELFYLLKELKNSLNLLSNIIFKGNYKENSLQFIEGFFDAEGCIKTIKEKERRLPKICLDICCTNFEILEFIKRLLNNHLDIEARYSIQEPFIGKDGSKRKRTYHLRIYRKEYVRKFFENIHTTKLKPEKLQYVKDWLGNKDKKEIITLQWLSNNYLQLVSSL